METKGPVISVPVEMRQTVTLTSLEARGYLGLSKHRYTDEEILAAYKLIARTEGVFVEPASAVCLAGLIHCVTAGKIPKGSVVAATMTGHGLKDPDNAMATAGVEPIVVPAQKEAVMKVMGL